MAAARDQNISAPVSLRRGVNVLSFRVVNGAYASGACARFLDQDDQPVIDIAISLTPPLALER